MEGVDGINVQKILSDSKLHVSSSIKKILEELNVKERKRGPLRLEITLINQDRPIYHVSVNEETLKLKLYKIIVLLQKLGNAFEMSMMRSINQDTLFQYPLEIGIPASISTVYSGIFGVEINKNTSKINDKVHLAVKSSTKAVFFMRTIISNHFPALNHQHSAGFARTLRSQSPSHFSLPLGSYMSNENAFSYSAFPPENQQSLIQTHATSFTFLRDDREIGDSETVVKLLSNSCPTCKATQFVSTGGEFSTKEVIDYPMIFGLRIGIRRYRCQSLMSNHQILSKAASFFDKQNKNLGVLNLAMTKFWLGYEHLVDYAFYWPSAEPCGFKLYQDLRNLAQVDGKISDLEKSENRNTGEVNHGVEMIFTYTFKDRPAPRILGVFLKESSSTTLLENLEMKVVANGHKQGDEGWVFCMDYESLIQAHQHDILAFVGDDEPFAKENFYIRAGRTEDFDKNKSLSIFQCVDSLLKVNISGVGSRSPEQIMEASGTPSDLTSILCAMDRQNIIWSGDNRIPPTSDCLQVAIEQTSLRFLNYSLAYEVDKSVVKQISRPLLFFRNVLSTFSADPKDDKVHPSHSDTLNAPTDRVVGSVDIEFHLRKINPVMDLHFYSADEQMFYHDVELDALSIMSIQPVSTRFDNMLQFKQKAGFIGNCFVTPRHQITFDNFKAAGKLTSCKTLLAADCGVSPEFAIYGKMAQENLEIYVEFPEDILKLSQNQIFVNGKKHDSSSQAETFTVSEVNGSIHVKNPTEGVYVTMIKDEVKITVTSKYKGVVCGLCGNFDTGGANDVLGPQGAMCSNEELLSAYSFGNENVCQKSTKC